MSEPEEKQFWADLQRAVARDEEAERRELAEAERFLAELDDDVEELSPERVEAIAAKALDQVARAEARPQSGRVLSMRRARHGLAAAAAAVVAPKFLVAAAAVAALTTGALVYRYTVDTVPFQEAVDTMLDESRPIEARRTAVGRVASEAYQSIGILMSSADDSTAAIASSASAAVQRLRDEVQSPRAFRPTTFAISHRLLGDRVLAPELTVGSRNEAIVRLTDQIAYGIRALQEATDDGDLEIARKASVFLEGIERALGQ